MEESRRSYEDRVRREEDEIAAREQEVGLLPAAYVARDPVVEPEQMRRGGWGSTGVTDHRNYSRAGMLPHRPPSSPRPTSPSFLTDPPLPT